MPPRLPRIIVLISHLQRPLQQSRLARVVTSVLPDYSGETNIRVLDTTVEESLQLARELEQNGEVEVFVCAGATAAYLRRHLTRPVLSMRVGGADLLWGFWNRRDCIHRRSPSSAMRESTPTSTRWRRCSPCRSTRGATSPSTRPGRE